MIRMMQSILQDDLREDYRKQQLQIVETISREELDALAAKHIDADAMITIVVCDKDSILPQPEGMPFNIVEVDDQVMPVARENQ